jgi:hypothetical protein
MSEPTTPTLDLTPVINMLNNVLPSILQIVIYSTVIGLVFKSLIPQLVESFKTY